MVVKLQGHRITQGNVPVIVHIPHNGYAFPYDASTPEHPQLNRTALENSLYVLADYRVDVLADDLLQALLSEKINPYRFENTFSRLYMDPERFPDDREVMNSRGMGVIYTKNHALQPLYDGVLPETEQKRRMAHYTAYHEAFDTLIDNLLQQYGECVILDLHSYASQALPYELYPDVPRAPLVFGTDSLHSSELMPILPQHTSWIAYNTVFQGTFVPTRFYQRDARVQSVMIEVRKDVYLNENTFHIRPNAAYYHHIIQLMEDIVRTALAKLPKTS